jgi:hypothetical protein
MNTIIAVFEKNWIETQMLFKFLAAFNISIQGQDTYGDRIHDVKKDYLFVNNETKIAKWMSKQEIPEILNGEFIHIMHYDGLLYNLKKNYTGK